MNTTSTALTTAIANVTDEQVDRCLRYYDCNVYPPVPFYMVQSESDDLVEYKVTYDAKGFHCTCPAGLEGFAHCHKTGVCKHVVWSLKAAQEFHNDEIAEQSAISSLMGSGLSRETATALAYGKMIR